MKTVSSKTFIIFLLLGLFISGFSRQVAAGTTQELNDYSSVVLQKINEARANPGAALDRLGLSEQAVREILGDDAWIINQGLPPLEMNTRLQEVALSHGHDMLSNDYYSHISPLEGTPADRIAATGYQAAEVDETLAGLDFDYYLDPESSVTRLLDNMLRDELTGVDGVSRNIFSTTLSDVGIAFLADSGSFLSERLNSYLLVIDFALSEATLNREGLTDQGYIMWKKINEARSNPRQVLARLGIDEDQAVAALGGNAGILDQGLPPLAWNDNLQKAAKNHTRDMFTNVYYDHISNSGLDPESRIVETGYVPMETGEVMGVLVYDNYRDIDTQLTLLIDAMLREELSGNNDKGLTIFSDSLTEVGIGFWTERVSELAGQQYAYLAVADFGLPVEDRRFAVGQIDPGYYISMRSASSNMWDEVEVLAGELFQLQLSVEGEDLLYWRLDEPDYVNYESTTGLGLEQNYDLDLRLNIGTK